MNTDLIHKTAIIDHPTVIGPNTRVWHFSHVMKNASIGQNCVLGQNTFIASNVSIGNHVKIQNNVSIYEGVEISDYVFLGPSMVFTNVINPRSEINRRGEYKKTKISKGVTIGANATIVCGITIGEYAFIGAGTVVTKDIPAFALVIGNPSKQSGWMSKGGEKLNFDTNGYATCSITEDRYKLQNEIVTCES